MHCVKAANVGFAVDQGVQGKIEIVIAQRKRQLTQDRYIIELKGGRRGRQLQAFLPAGRIDI